MMRLVRWIQTATKAFRGIPRSEKGLLSLPIEDGVSPWVVGSPTDREALKPPAEAFYNVARRAIVSMAMAARALP